MKLRFIQNIHNAEIIDRRVEQGLSQIELGEAAETTTAQVQILEQLRPWTGLATLEALRKVAIILDSSPDVLFPPWARQSLCDFPLPVESSISVEDIDLSSMFVQDGINKNLNEIDVLKFIWDGLAILRPQDRDIMIARYGLDGQDPATHGELGELYNLTRARIKQRVDKSLKLMFEHRILLEADKKLVKLHNLIKDSKTSNPLPSWTRISYNEEDMQDMCPFCRMGVRRIRAERCDYLVHIFYGWGHIEPNTPKEMKKFSRMGFSVYTHPVDIEWKDMKNKDKALYFCEWFMVIPSECTCVKEGFH